MLDDDEEGDPIEPLDVEEGVICLEREQARARGEKRVYFSDVPSAEDDGDDDDDAYEGIIQDSEMVPQNAEKRPPLEPSHSSSGVDEFFDVDGGDDDDRSLYTDADERSIYSRHSVLDPERSAVVRDRFMKRVESVYNKSVTYGGVDDIPEVPELPKSLRDAVPADRRGILKSSSPNYF